MASVWLTDNISHMVQSVFIHNLKSVEKQIGVGVPQGSIY